jgi:hypothetical protein
MRIVESDGMFEVWIDQTRLGNFSRKATAITRFNEQCGFLNTCGWKRVSA